MNNDLKRYLSCFVVILILLLLTVPVSADVGPKPGMIFDFEYQIEQTPPIIRGQVIGCEDAACTQGEPLPELGPQQFWCQTDPPNLCRISLYTSRPFYKLVVEFADRTRESNTFEKRAFEDHLRVTVLESTLQVESTAWSASNFMVALLITLGVEGAVAALAIRLFKWPWKVLGWVLLASLISLPLVWFVLSALPAPAGLVMCIYELFAVAFEAGFIYLGNRRQGFGLKQAIPLSLVMNLASFIGGFAFIG
jgi:hypothetical protein